MDLRNERGAISGAEGCMFGAMALFALLLVGLLVVAFFRFQEPPQGPAGPGGAPPPRRPETRPERAPTSLSDPAWRLASDDRQLRVRVHRHA